MDLLDAWGFAYDDTPGVSSFCGAAAALNAEYTLPGVSQTVIITRMEGRTPVPEGERLAALAAHGATMVIFLSIGLIDKVQAALLQGAYTAATPAAVVYKATWPEEKILRCTVGTLAAQTQAAGITKTALIVVGDFLAARYDRSCLYDRRLRPSTAGGHSHELRLSCLYGARAGTGAAAGGGVPRPGGAVRCRRPGAGRMGRQRSLRHRMR